MAAGISSAGQLAELIQLARRRVGQVLLPAVLTGSLGVMAGSLMPAKYKAETEMELATVPQPLVDAGLDQGKLRDRMRAAETVLKTFDRMDEVLTTLEWEHYQTLPPDERREFVAKFNKDVWITTRTPEGTNLLFMTFGCRDTDPQRAAQFANELRDYFVRDLIENATQEARDKLDLLQKDFQVAEQTLDDASRSLEDLRKEHKISPTQTFGTSAVQRETDPLYVQLQSERAELAGISKEIQTAEATLQAFKLKRESLPAEIVQSETQVGGVDLSDAIELQRQRITEARVKQTNRKPANSVWERAQREIEDAEQQLAVLEGKSDDPTRIQNKQPNPAIARIDQEIDEIDVNLARHRAQLAVVERNIADLEPRVASRIEVYYDFERATMNYNQAIARHMQLSSSRDVQRALVSNLALPDFTPFDINQQAVPPTKPSSPSALLVVAGGLVLGLALGALYALAAEFGRNAYRSPGDLARALPAPVLGAINEIVTVRERRQRALRSGLVGASTLILAGSVLWVTWAFHARPGLLGPELSSWLDEVRGQLR